MLSPVPRPGRPQLEIELIGRDADVGWLRTTTGDRLITGQPGSGKTFLLRYLAREGWGVFLHGDDQGEIRNALLAQRPDVVIVDDAHKDPNRLIDLRHLRQEIEHDFAIVATCWEGERDAVAEALESLPASRIRHLELLTRAQILEVILQTGVRARNRFLELLVTQAANKPGLAVTLATFCLRDSWTEVLRGDALARSLMTDFSKLVDKGARDFLAVLGISGDRGMPIEIASKFLEIRFHRARQMASQLAMGGVLSEVGERALAVRPEALRSALLRQVFFEGPIPPLEHRSLLKLVPSYESSIEAVVIAVHYGAEIPTAELQSLVEQCCSPGVWRQYTALGEHEARWALKHYPGDWLDLAREALPRTPRATIPRLLEHAVSATGSLDSDRPLRLLRDWLEDFDASSSIERRRLVIQQAKSYLKNGGDRGVGIHALLLPLSPKRRGLTPHPADDSLTIRWDLLPLEDLRQIETLWNEVRDAIEVIDATVWRQLKDALWGWIHPTYSAGRDVPHELKEAMHAFAAKALRDLVPSTEGSPGLTAGLKRLAKPVGIELVMESDPVFELLYPDDYEDLEDMRSREEIENTAVHDLAIRWATERRPQEVASELGRYEREAERIGHRKWPPRAHSLCRRLAELVDQPASWLSAFLEQDFRGELLQPFLARTATIRSDGWETALREHLRHETQAWVGVELILRLREPPPELLEDALVKATTFPRRIEVMCLRKQVPASTLGILLVHPDPEVAFATAVGEWNADPQGSVAEKLNNAWQRAILRSALIDDERILSGSDGLGYWLGEILSNDPELAFKWLGLFLKRDSEPLAAVRRGLVKTVGVLRKAHLLALVEQLDPGLLAHWLLPHLIGRRASVYSKLLGLDRLKDYHLRPLAGKPNAEWAELAKLALTTGHEPRDIARASFQEIHSYSSFGQEYWAEWDGAFAELESNPDEDLREVARYGRDQAQGWIRRAAARQRQHDLDGS